ALTQHMMSPWQTYKDFHIALPFPLPGGSSGRRSATEKTRAPSARAAAAGESGVPGRVGRAVVHNHDLVDERELLDEASMHRRDNAADGGFFITRRKAHRNGGPGAGLRRPGGGGG